MEYQLDIAPDHLVEWLSKDIMESGKTRFDISASRSFRTEVIRNPSTPLNNEDMESLQAVTGILEIKPRPDSAGRWVLKVQVDDILGPHLPEEGSIPDEPEELSLAGFEADFIAPDRGTSFVTLELESDNDKAYFETFLNDLQTDRHRTVR
jgi:hypothetical protein